MSKKKDKNEWDKKRLLIETITAFVICFISFKFGENQTQIIYNGDVITYEIYNDTVKSIKELNEVSSQKATGSDIADYALQFEGNPYLWGGTSLTQGTDASGFIVSVFNHFGFVLPHSSQAITNIGEKIEEENILPGDVVCYNDHIGIYVGDNKIIHASNPKSGIVVTNMNYKEPISIRRIVQS